MDPTPAGWDTDATMDFADGNGPVTECTEVAVDPGNQTSCTISDPAAGTYHYTATYSGNATVATSVSTELEVIVVADTVEATGVGVNYGTFYPVSDNYRDTLRISGNRHEPIAVTIRIYNSNGKRVALVSKSRASGGYAYEWNGKKSGTLLPAGKYRIVQTLVDAAGTTKAYTDYANLSHKKLVTVTKTITKKGSALTTTLGKVAVSGSTVRIRAGADAGGAGWQFKIPSAVIYKSLSFRVNAAAHFSAPPSEIAIQNFNICSVWNTGCFDRWKGIGNTSGARKWYGTSGSPSSHRKGHVVRGIVYVPVGTVYVYQAEVKVKYQILK